jgi:hypothetical protein
MLEQRASKRVGPNKDKISRSPIMDRSNEKVRRKKAPPARYRAPKPNTNIEPLERKYDLSRSRGGLLDDRMKRSNNWQQRSGGGRQRMNER